MSLYAHIRLSIIACHVNNKGIIAFCNLEVRVMVDSRKQPSAYEDIEARRGIASRNIDSFPAGAMFLPFYGNTVRCILRSEAEPGWYNTRPKLFEANKTDAGYAHSTNELRTKRVWQKLLEAGGIKTIIDEETSINRALKGRNIHSMPHFSEAKAR